MDLEVKNNNVDIEQNLNVKEQEFFETTFGKIVDSGIDIGIRAIFPEFMEEEIIDIKNVIITDGFKSGVEEAISSCNDFAKCIKGIATGNFENLDQIDMAIKKGGVIDSVSKIIDSSLKIAVDSNLLNKNISKIIKSSKNVLLDNVNSKIGEGVKEQVKNVEKLKEHSEKWQKAYNEQDFDKMKKSYTFVKKYSDKVMPVKELISKVNEIENIQTLLENNGGNFEIEETKLELAKVL